MADQRGGGISWTEETWNPIRGCTRVSEGCRHCYAETVAGRFSDPGQPYHGLAMRTTSGARWTGKVVMVPERLTDPLRWKRPRLIFVNSMSDLFHESLTFEQIDQVVAVMALSSQHRFQVLTKRPARMMAYLDSRAKSIQWIEHAARRLGYTFSLSADLDPMKGSIVGWPLSNVWWGTSVENQATADERIPHLLACRPHAAVLWLSLEPLLGPVSLHDSRQAVDWVVAGGESGANARPMHPAWARSIRDECRAAGVPFHFKQWGEWTPGVNVEGRRGTVRTAIWMNGTWMFGAEDLAKNEGHVDDEPDLYRVGKKAAGRLLDGRVHDDMPARPAEG